MQSEYVILNSMNFYSGMCFCTGLAVHIREYIFLQDILQVGSPVQ